MSIDREKIRFKGKVISAALLLNASANDSEARSFVEQLYEEWRAARVPLEECSNWLMAKLARAFVSYRDKPEWVENEPSWPFFDGKPMIFLSQTRMDNDSISRDALSPGETVYVFAARQIASGGFRMVYRVVSQFEPSS